MHIVTQMIARGLVMFCLFFGVPWACNAQESADLRVWMTETFDSLDQWQPLTFPKIKRHTVYSIVQEGGDNMLKAETDNAAAGLVYAKTFNVYGCPVVRWRWKISNVYEKGDAREKKGDDYPIRIYVIFKYDPATADFLTRTTYRIAKAIYGDYPPHSSLNYIWANRRQTTSILPNPYTDRAMMVILRTGDAEAGTWVTESVDVLADYRKAFLQDPPAEASLAVMSDSDDTGEKATAFIDHIEVLCQR